MTTIHRVVREINTRLIQYSYVLELVTSVVMKHFTFRQKEALATEIIWNNSTRKLVA